ncbi:hypothetical protein JKF63_06881 [Porcisia hertigi]|uniref:Uncharacterized protein n=1 Tax=Porcisia hertigi TaxID=2761500 RepID=A0A836YGG9_9TRYP|nr:hypothetical protein JKF63_06881 [Porcisia hertigi]
MRGAILRPSCVLHAALLFSSSAGLHHDSAGEAAMVGDEMSSTAAASLWLQNSELHHAAAAVMHTQQADAAGATAAAQDHESALVVLGDNSTTSTNGHVDYFMGGFGPCHLAEVAVVPESARVRAHGPRGHMHKLHTAAAPVGASFSSEPVPAAASAALPRRAGDDGEVVVAKRPVITKARRIRLASAAAQAAEVLQAVGSPATALLLSQRVQQLQAEEALLNASLQRLKAERDLATVRHTCGEELNNYRHGVQQREQRVVRAAMTDDTRFQDPVVSYSQESGDDTLQTLSEADLLGMPATADAEAAAASAAATATVASRAVKRSNRISHADPKVPSARKRWPHDVRAAGVHKTKAAPKPPSWRGAKPGAPHRKSLWPPKQMPVRARGTSTGKQLSIARARKHQAKTPLRMKERRPTSSTKATAAKMSRKYRGVKAKTPAAAIKGVVRGQRMKAASAAARLSRTPSLARAKPQRGSRAPAKGKSATVPPAKSSKSKATKAVPKKSAGRRR